MVVDHAEHIGGDAAVVALVQALEGEVVARTGRCDEGLV
jgi:hypothetical protein